MKVPEILARRPVVYRLYDRKRLIYVGATVDLSRRLGEHRKAAWWFPLVTRSRLQVFPDLDSARAAESVAIQEEAPMFNQLGTGRPPKSEAHWTRRDRAMAHEFATRWMREERNAA